MGMGMDNVNAAEAENAIEIDVGRSVDIRNVIRLVERIAEPFLVNHPRCRTTFIQEPDGSMRFLFEAV